MQIDNIFFEQEILAKVERPSQYTGGETNSKIKDWQQAAVKMCFAFPDTYEIGMSHLGLRLLYETINNHSSHLCERTFMPLDDMAALLRVNNLPLFSWESRHGLNDFDIVGFTLQSELSYTNILAMLDLAQIPVFSEQRSEDDPLIIAGGPCVYNPEPLADFIDLFVIGEGEEIILELLNLVAKAQSQGLTKEQLLAGAAHIEGIYVPRFYTARYKDDGRFDKLVAADDLPATIKKRILTDIDQAPFPDSPLLPTLKPVHDRIMLEIMRGCTRGCRFCQAGMIYRPLREKSAETLLEQARMQAKNSGYDEITLLSLSSADYSDIIPLMEDLLTEHSGCGISISLPSLRVDAMSVGLAARTQEVRKSGITLAPEAGSQHLRDIINKGVTEEDILGAIIAAFSQGYTSVKLYFMLGLPYEDDADIFAIADLCQKIVQLAKKHKPREIKKPLKITLGVASFVPKTHTPFQWAGQASMAKLQAKQQLLRYAIRPLRQVSVNFHDARVSLLEAALARGDRRIAKALYLAWQKGCHLDGWSEHFAFESWQEAFAEAGLSATDIAEQQFAFGEALPWQHIDCGVSQEWLIEEAVRAARAQLTADCRYGECNGCGVCDQAWQNVYAPKRELALVPRTKKQQASEQLYKYRCRLAISGAMIWVSHLDLLSAMEKALRRSGLPIAYSQGFNPHMQISWGPAHPVGLASDSEYLDLTFKSPAPQDWQELLATALPEGLKLVSGREITMPTPALMAEINYAAYRLEFAEGSAEQLAKAVAALHSADTCFIERHRPKGDKIVDIRPAIAALTQQGSAITCEIDMAKGAAPKPQELAELLLPGSQAAAFRLGMYIKRDGELQEP